MSERRNDIWRSVVGFTFYGWGIVLEWWHRRRLRAYAREQQWLRDRCGLNDSVPVLRFGPEVARQWVEHRSTLRGEIFDAQSSGSLGVPKQVAYSSRRLFQVKWVFFEALCRIFRRLPIRRRTLFVLAPSREDASLTSALLKERRTPPWWICAQAPYRLQSHPALIEAISLYGDTAVKAWLMALSNPGILYATNPSTVVMFLEDLESRWSSVRRLAQDSSTQPKSPLARLTAKIASRGALQRLQAIAQAETPLPFSTLVPGLEWFMSWDGGYVRPFLERARALLGDGCRFLPMYSMSTEVIETVPHVEPDAASVAYLPMAPGVLYEFLPESEPTDLSSQDVPSKLVAANDVREGHRYTMVVSDVHGLKRYQTEDVFRCVGKIEGLPDLRFEKRRALAYSFTGEKLTGDQLQRAFDEMASHWPHLRTDGFLTAFPCSGSSATSPHYKIVWVQRRGTLTPLPEDLASRVDDALGRLNGEYLAKRESRRLGPPQLRGVSLSEFLKRAGTGPTAATEGPSAQFKFLPLYLRLWGEEAGLTSSDAVP